MAEIPHEPWTAQETPYLREMSIEEWIEKNPLPGLTITQMILSRAGAAFIDAGGDLGSMPVRFVVSDEVDEGAWPESR